ncbi:ABC transporter ATP-binding protein [Dialister invisus]|uniref:ABC transporter ATP-binding protein n=1 Tax=Dialister invisus TaxID=218538 RepID=UPI003AB8A62B
MILDIQNVSCRYTSREKDTLTGVNLRIEEGEMVLIAGRSGCGKSTLVKAVTGLLDKEDGSIDGKIFLDGKDTAAMSAEEIGVLVGTVYQTPDDQIFAMTVADEVGFALENRGIEASAVKEKVKEVLARMGLDGMEERSIHALSGGQRQRLALASVLVTKPKLLILDEPVSQMNPQGVQSFLELLVSLQREEHMTIVVVEHRVNELAAWFPRLCIMHKGYFVYDGLMDESWYVLDQNDGYGIREPQSVKLGRFMKLEKLSYSLKKTAEEIKQAGIKFQKSIGPCIVEDSSDELILEGKNITYRYPGADSDILNGLNFKIKKGSINALMGFNGAGKSTLMNILSGLEEPSSGEILIHGKSIGKRREYIGYMLQEADLMLLNNSVREELLWNNKTMTEKELDILLHKLHVYHYRDDFPLALSKGQRLRVVLGALLSRRDNELLLLDEPTTGQDQKSLENLSILLSYAAEQGKTIFFCTHDIELASSLADRIFVLAQGHFVAVGAPHEIFSNKEVLRMGGLSMPPMLELSEYLGIDPCITVKEVMRHVL